MIWGQKGKINILILVNIYFISPCTLSAPVYFFNMTLSGYAPVLKPRISLRE